MNAQTGVVIGKFLPPHRGHHLLIETAQSQCADVAVIVCERADDSIPGTLRAEWLRETHPAARVLLIDDVYDPDDSQVWADNTIRWLGRAPEVVFTSEEYGEHYARLMGAAHQKVDRERVRVPCSGTAIRTDPHANWQFLAPCVRAHFALRVCIVGAESTGTTTLAQALARQLGTCWVPEYGREYCEHKFSRGDSAWSSDEFVHIAREQTRREDLAAREANRIVIGDTNAFATALWHRRYLGFDDARLEAVARAVRCDLYILTGDEIPFVQDGLRDGEAIRHEMHGWFESRLRQQTVPHIIVRGSPAERLSQSLAAIRKLFEMSAWQPGASGQTDAAPPASH